MRTEIERQIADLRVAVTHASRLRHGATAIAALCLLGALIWWHPVPLMVGAFLALFALVAREAEPRLAAALAAYDAARPVVGGARISAIPDRENAAFQAEIREPGHAVWAFEFVPILWSPAPGAFTANIWRDAKGVPVLATIDAGVLVPRYAPTLQGVSQ